MEFTPEQKKIIASYVQWQLKRKRITQKQIAKAHGCCQGAVSRAIHQGQLHEAMSKLKNYIAHELGRKNWEELCAEALTHEAVGV